MIRDHTLETVIAGLLPQNVIVRAGPIVAAGALPAIEAALVARAVQTRRAEFASGRALARAALAALDRPVPALGATRDAGPAWPQGVIGSLTHADGVVAAAVAVRGALTGLGIDIEGPRLLEASVWESVFTAAERATLCDARAAAQLFSAKEAAFKCLAALGPLPTDFSDFELIATRDGYRVRLASAARPLAHMRVRTRLHGERIVCAACCHSATGQPD